MVRKSSRASSEKQESWNLRGIGRSRWDAVQMIVKDLAYRQSSIVATAFKENIAFLWVTGKPVKAKYFCLIIYYSCLNSVWGMRMLIGYSPDG